MSLEESNSLIKLVVIGDTGVGKTCLILRYVDNEYKDHFNQTIGVEYKIKDIDIESESFKLQLWDTAGQERFRSIAESYYRGSDGAVITFSISDRSTFENVNNWIETFQNITDSNSNIIIVGNKCDDIENRRVSTEEANEFAKSKNFEYIETSAKDDKNVNEAFSKIINIIYKSRKESNSLKSNRLKSINIKNNEEKKSCC